MGFAASLCIATAVSAGVTVALEQRAGPNLQVAVRLRDFASSQAAGYQVFLEFDTSRMSFVSGSYITTNFGLPVIAPIAASGNQLSIAAGVFPLIGQSPTSVDQDVAILEFAPIGTGCEPRIRVRASANPPTRVTDANAEPLLPLTIVNLWNPCPADANRSGMVSVQDIFDFLTLWFSGDCRADFNNSAGVSVQDLFDFLSAWFAGCT